MTTILEYSEHLAAEAAQSIFPNCEVKRCAAKTIIYLAIFKALLRLIQEHRAELSELLKPVESEA